MSDAALRQLERDPSGRVRWIRHCVRAGIVTTGEAQGPLSAQWVEHAWTGPDMVPRTERRIEVAYPSFFWDRWERRVAGELVEESESRTPLP